jgi:hypothetical protein
MTRNELRDRLGYCVREIDWLRAITPNCTRCDHFKKDGMCALHGEIVPDDFVAQGCDHWKLDDAPF